MNPTTDLYGVPTPPRRVMRAPAGAGDGMAPAVVTPRRRALRQFLIAAAWTFAGSLFFTACIIIGENKVQR